MNSNELIKIKSNKQFLKWFDPNDNAYVHCNFHSLSMNTIGQSFLSLVPRVQKSKVIYTFYHSSIYRREFTHSALASGVVD